MYENANLWQTSLSNWLLTNCSQRRGIADVAADADPNSGASVYDSTKYSGQSGWWIVGGTSLSSPLIASSYVLAGGSSSGNNASSVLYSNFPSGFHDVASGGNGNCSTIMCKGVVGYDGPTGLGSPNGLLAFIAGASATPTPTPTATPSPSLTPTPSATPTPTLTPTPTPVDTVPPVVSITSPHNNSLVRHSSSVTINVSASDNVAVAKVDMYLNGVLGATATKSPYVFLWNVASFRTRRYTLTAKAYDTSGNTSTSTITVTSY